MEVIPPNYLPEHYLQDTLMSKTLKTNDTIKRQLAFFKQSTQEALVVLELGDGLNGHANIAHGGFVSVMLDDVMGVANTHSKPYPTFTAYLNVTFKRPVPTPSVLLCRGWISKMDGRKRYSHATIENGSGEVYATADALFLELKALL